MEANRFRALAVSSLLGPSAEKILSISLRAASSFQCLSLMF
jgi:hypothetical protein